MDEGEAIEYVVLSMTFMRRKVEVSRAFSNEFILTEPKMFQSEVKAMFDDLYEDFMQNETR
jgi:hypothetical protein